MHSGYDGCDALLYGKHSADSPKTEISQLARKYILRMETVGYLTTEDNTSLCQELSAAGVTEINLSGTTQSEVSYGVPITLQISGKLKGEYLFEEKRTSTAKN